MVAYNTRHAHARTAQDDLLYTVTASAYSAGRAGRFTDHDSECASGRLVRDALTFLSVLCRCRADSIVGPAREERQLWRR